MGDGGVFRTSCVDFSRPAEGCLFLLNQKKFFFPCLFYFREEKTTLATPICPFTILPFTVYFLLLSLSEDRLDANNMNEMLDIEDRLKDILA
jgi:hypothetical protein